MVLKRYEYWGWNEQEMKAEKKWTSWFPWNSDERPQWQYEHKLKCEYKDE